jgi:catechol 2,3-dioxygenase-like lactoylglutathione lyase family enzyme
MAAIPLARGLLDPGLFSDNEATMRKFYEGDVGLPMIERLPHSDTYAEVFFELLPGKLKIQSFVEPIAPAVTGYRELLIARPGLTEPVATEDPDGLRVHLVPSGHRGVTTAGYVVSVPDVDAQLRFLADGMGAVEADGGYRVGDTQLFVEEGPRSGEPTPAARKGFVYLTMIVHDCAAAHAQLLRAGATHSLRMLRLADRCLFSWVRDPNGNWVEIVQYAELSGPLPDIDRLDQHWDEVTEWRENGTAFA